jgi:putative protease
MVPSITVEWRHIMAEQEIGVIQHYFDKISVAIITVTQGELNVGDTVHIKGHTSDVSTQISSMQFEHKVIEKVKVGESAGIKVPSKVRIQDKVFKVTP